MTQDNMPRFIHNKKFLLVQVDARFLLEKAGTYAEVCQTQGDNPTAIVALNVASLRVRFGIRPDGKAASNLELLESAAAPENNLRLYNTAAWMIEDSKFAFALYPTAKGNLDLCVPYRPEPFAVVALAEYLMDPANEPFAQKLRQGFKENNVLNIV